MFRLFGQKLAYPPGLRGVGINCDAFATWLDRIWNRQWPINIYCIMVRVYKQSIVKTHDLRRQVQ